MKNWNVHTYGNTRWNRAADRIDWLMDAFVVPISMGVFFSCLTLAAVAGVIALIVWGIVSLI